MRIGIPAETRSGETRVAATPETVKKLISGKHQVIVQSGAGVRSAAIDEAYLAAGAQIGSAADAFDCELVLKVRAPSAEERAQIAASLSGQVSGTCSDVRSLQRALKTPTTRPDTASSATTWPWYGGASPM